MQAHRCVEYALVLMNRPPSMGHIAPLPCGCLGRVNPERKSGVTPRRRICDQTDTPPAASAEELVPNVLGFLSFGAYQLCREGDSDAWATQVLHIIYPGMCLGEDTSALSHGVDTTRETALTGYKPYCLTGGGCFDGGRDPRISLDSYRSSQAGQPPAR